MGGLDHRIDHVLPRPLDWRPLAAAFATVPMAMVSVLTGPYGGTTLFNDTKWYATGLRRLLLDGPLYDPAMLGPHPLQEPAFWDQAPSTALFTLLLLPGYWLWGGLMVASVVMGIVLVWPRIGLSWSVVLGAVLIAWMPMTGALVRGNLNAIVFLLLAVAVRFPRQAGVAIGIAAAAKLVPLLGVAWLLGKRDYRGALVACAIPLAMTLAVVVWKGPETIGDFVTLRLNQWTPEGTIYHWGVADLTGSALTGYALAVALAVASWRRASFTLAIAAMLTSVPVMHVHYWTWVLVPLAAVWTPHWIARRRRADAV